MYEISRNIYGTATSDYTEEARISILQGTLAQLRLTNIATLDACMNHFTRLIDLTSADEDYISSLANILAPCIIRPRAETSLTMEEKHAYRLIRDLFQYKEPIFTELKRMSASNTGSLSGATGNRPRAISTDESNRRANMEERNRLLLEKSQAVGGTRSRATSPAPSPRTGHRRDRSVGGPETRFPIQTSPTTGERQRTSLGSVVGGVAAKRQSLEPPEVGTDSPERGRTSERFSQPPADVPEGLAESPLEKRNSLGRAGARFSGGRRVTASSGSGNAEISAAPRGVTLEDKPMDD